MRQQRQDRSFWLILPGFLVVYYAAPLEYMYEVETIPHSIWMQIAGLVLITAGLMLFGCASWALKGMYSGWIRVMNSHTLIQDGPYHDIRHPAYAAYLIMGLGIAIGFSSLISLLAVPILLLPGPVYRINVEEKIITAEFGEQYIQYSRLTRHLIPGIW